MRGLFGIGTLRPGNSESSLSIGFLVLTMPRKYFGWLWRIHPAEMFPLIASGAVVLQSCVVLPVQAIDTGPIFFDGCAKTVQLVWPG